MKHRSVKVFNFMRFQQLTGCSHVGWCEILTETLFETQSLFGVLPTIRMLLWHRMVGKFRGDYVPINEIHWTESAHPTRL